MRMNSRCVIICSCWQFSCHWDWCFQLPLSLSIKIAFFPAIFSLVLGFLPAQLSTSFFESCVWIEIENTGMSSTPSYRSSENNASLEWLSCREIANFCVKDCNEEEKCIINLSVHFFVAIRRSNRSLFCVRFTFLDISDNPSIDLWGCFLIIFIDPAQETTKSSLLAT